ncbi:hypothetical protein [Nitrospirillum iridis]|uniref:Glutamine synthetase n=1 Tax=Nitrospirillum iridis TaxID=765888 RepID=A0A7X0B2H6_9PROT|nr:hypothetical protein [Nitrospirillum iridis]MBB6253029.1 glutamine synthetase [Nitrospirillum iridis]
MTDFITAHARLVGDAAGYAIHRTQEIPREFTDHLQALRDASVEAPMGNHHLTASVPAAVHEKWLREGYDCTREPIRRTLKRLRDEGLDAFIATKRRI